VLQIIAGNLSLLARDMGEHPAARRHMDGAMAGVQMGTRLARTFLGGVRDHTATVLDLRSALPAMRMALESAVGPDVLVICRAGDRASLCQVNAAAFENVMLNLAINARDAMAGEGELTIKLARETTSTSDHHVISIGDTGCGMTPDLVARAFEPFFTTKGEHGSGLGLTSVARFAEKCGGSVAVVSKVGVGTTIMVRIPVIEPR
jgi:signal transduction histidine kinase